MLLRKIRKLLCMLRSQGRPQQGRGAYKFSAYLSIYNDWNILAPALKSVAPYVDELVVVDGAYEWMVPYLKALGIDPTRSDERVYDAIRASGIPFRTIKRTWSNEIEKRRTGYEACKHRYVYRVDADEIVYFDDDSLSTFLAGGYTVGEMQMPLYAAPGWIVRRRDQPHMPCQCFLFDREKVSSDIHLNYLWLVLTADELPTAGKMPFPVYGKPLAFNAHLTHWRLPETAVNRGAFYVMNWMRKNGVPWIPSMKGVPVEDFAPLFAQFPAASFRDSLMRGGFPIGTMSLQASEYLQPSPLSGKDEAKLRGLYETFLDHLAEQNVRGKTQPQTLIYGEQSFIDISSYAARNALAPRGEAVLHFSADLASATLKLHRLATNDPQYIVEDIPFTLDGNKISFILPPSSALGANILRQVVELNASGRDQNPICTYLIAS